MLGKASQIKKFVCPQCADSKTVEDWNEKTESMYGTYIYPIEDDENRNACYFVCPSCESNVTGDSIIIYKEGESS